MHFALAKVQSESQRLFVFQVLKGPRLQPGRSVSIHSLLFSLPYRFSEMEEKTKHAG